MSWQPPPLIDHNGPLTGYVIEYRRITHGDTLSETVNDGTVYVHSIMLLGVTEIANYSVSVAAMNVNGTGPFSKPVVQTVDGGGKYKITTMEIKHTFV